MGSQICRGSTISGDGDGSEEIRYEESCYDSKKAVEVEILVEWSRSSNKTKKFLEHAFSP